MSERGHVRLITLGSFRINDPPTVAATQLGGKDRALVGILAAKVNTPIQRHFIYHLLWPDVAESRARRSLSQSIYSIKRALPGWLQSEGSQLKLTISPTAVDIHRALSLTSADDLDALCDLLRGEFLGDVSIGAPAFDDWRDSVNFQFYRKAELLALTMLSQSNVSRKEKKQRIDKLLTVMPYSEPLRRLEADLFEQLQAEAAFPDRPDGETDTSASLPFVGRQGELAKLRRYLTESREGKGRFVLLIGSAGQGKSRLIDEFITRNDNGTRTISVSCFEPERHIGLSGISDLLQSMTTNATIDTLPTVYAAALAQLIPSATQAPPPLPPPISNIGSQRRLFEAILRVIQMESSRTPMLLVVDDLQWADQSTLAFLHLLARRIEAWPVIVICAARWASRIRSLAKSPTVNKLVIRELTEADVETLRKQKRIGVFHEKYTTNSLMKLTAGNAFLLTEILKVANAPGLTSMRQTLASHGTRDFIRTSLAGLPGTSIQVIAALAILGRPVPVDVLRAVSGLTQRKFLRSIQQLINRRIVSVHEHIAFRHDLIREGVYRRIPPLKREYVHLRAAEALKSIGASAGRLARHYCLAGRNETAHSYARVAAADADKRSAMNEAIYFLKLGIRTAPDKQTRTQLHCELAHRSFKMRRYGAATRHAHKALADPKNVAPADQARLVLLELEILVTLGRISANDLAAHLADFERTYLGCLGSDVRYEMLRLLIRSSAIEGDSERCADLAAEMVSFAETAEGVLAAKALSLAARSHSFAASSTRAMPWAEKAERLVDTDTDPELAAEILTNVGSVYYEAGKYNRALDLYNSALSYIQTSGALHIWPRTATHKHMLLVEMGRFDDARSLQSEISAGWNVEDAWQHLSTLEGNVSLMHFNLGDLERTAEHARASLEYAAQLGMYTHRLTATALLGLTCIESGRLSEANQYADDLKHEMGDRKRVGDFSFVDIFTARWHSRHGRTQKAIRHLEEAIEDCSDRDVGSWLRLRVELAAHLRRVDHNRAVELATHARDLACTIGARTTYDKASSLIARMK